MIYTHWAEDRFTLDPSRLYEQRRESMKPKGLWLAIDGDWKRWCDDEGWGLRRRRVEYVCEFDRARVCTLIGPEAIDAFTFDYRVIEEPSHYWHDMALDWPKIAQTYAGLDIPVYCWERRDTDHTLWYYGWDCASACIWDCSIITRFEPVT